MDYVKINSANDLVLALTSKGSVLYGIQPGPTSAIMKCYINSVQREDGSGRKFNVSITDTMGVSRMVFLRF